MFSRVANSAKDLGFIAIGFSRPVQPPRFDEFCAWLSGGKHGEMSWLERNLDVRKDPSRLLEGCGTIISLAYPYPPQRPATPDGFTVSRYSQPTSEDYHYRLRILSRKLIRVIQDMYPKSRSRVCVDSAPILEKSFACASGIGFIGKNNMLIMPGRGSYFYLAEILTTASLEFPSVMATENHCGACTLCIDSCPTGALENPFDLNASRCLSYLTIEYRGPVKSTYGKKMGRCFFGCDRCQEICPYNKEDTSSLISLPSTDEFLRMGEKDFKERFGKTAFGRAGLGKLKTNIQAVRC
jgi:epoxyqueuosine reductase